MLEPMLVSRLLLDFGIVYYFKIYVRGWWRTARVECNLSHHMSHIEEERRSRTRSSQVNSRLALVHRAYTIIIRQKLVV